MVIPPAFERPYYSKQNCSTSWETSRTTRHVKSEIFPDIGADFTIRGTFLRWFLLEAVTSAAAPVAHIEIECATFTEVLNLEATTINLLLRFVECTFDQSIQMSDATIVGEMVGGSAAEIMADRLTVKGPMRLRAGKPIQRSGPHLTMLRLCGAEIRGNLDMRGCSLETKPDDDKPSLFADGLKVHGSILLSDGFTSFGEVRLNGSSVGRNLDCSGAILSNVRGYSLSAAGAHIVGTAYFSETHEWITYPEKKPFYSHGTLRLEGANIEGDLICTAGRFCAARFLPSQTKSTKFSDQDLEAIAADGLKVGSDIYFGIGNSIKDKFEARGTISLINARVGGDFSCDAAILIFPGEEPLSADGIVVDGTTFFTQIETDGILRFVQASLKQGFYLNGATFDTTRRCHSWTKERSNAAMMELGGPCSGVFARLAQIGGTFRWHGVSAIKSRGQHDPNTFWLFIPGSTANRIEDDQLSWAALDRFEITDCHYDAIANLSDADLGWRLDELDRQYAARKAKGGPAIPAAKQFRPQPYIQLATTFRESGYETAAQKSFVRLERNRTSYGNVGHLHWLWRKCALDGCLRYGYSPLRPIVLVLLWAAVSAVLFQKGYDSHQIVPTKENQVVGEAPFLPQHARIPFNATVYAVDTLIPIVDLNQRKNWTVL